MSHPATATHVLRDLFRQAIRPCLLGLGSLAASSGGKLHGQYADWEASPPNILPNERTGAGSAWVTGTGRQFPNFSAFAALTADGSIVSWGSSGNGGSGAPAGNGYTSLCSSIWGFAAIADDGSLRSWGTSGASDTPPAGTGFREIYSSGGSFSALKSDGTVVGWGDDDDFQYPAPKDNGYTAIVAGGSNYAGLKADGAITCWGRANTAPAGSGYTKVIANRAAFAALDADGAIRVWGSASHGGSIIGGLGYNGAPGGTGFTALYSNQEAFAALRTDGSIAAWGNSGGGGFMSPGGTGYTNIYSSNMAFAALRPGGYIAAWGQAEEGGSGAPTDGGYTAVVSTSKAFAALKADGSISVWGHAFFGGSSSDIGSDIIGAPADAGYVTIYSNSYAFAALKADGTIRAWGSAAFGGSAAPTGNGFTKIYATAAAFAAQKADGSIRVWGSESQGGSSTNGTTVLGAAYTGAPGGTGYRIQSAFYESPGPGVATALGVVTPTTAVLGGRVTSDAGKTITGRGVVYATSATNANPEIGGAGVTQLTESPAGTLGGYSFPLSGLTANTAYAFKAYVTDSEGKTYYSGAQEFSTNRLPVVAPPPASLFQMAFNFLRGSRLGAGEPLTISVGGGHFKPGSAYQLQLFSSPVTLALGITGGDGSLTLSVALPESIEAGSHRLVLTGTQADDSPLSLETTLSVEEDGRVTGMLDRSWFSVVENATNVAGFSASDADLPAQDLEWSVGGGADAAHFAIDSMTGDLRFVTAPDYESPADADADNVYEVIVQVTDDGNTPQTSRQAVAVTVANAAEAPAVTAPTATAVANFRATLGGTVVNDGGLGGSISERGVVLAVTSLNGDPQIGGGGVTRVAATGSGLGAFSVAALQLSPNTSYSYRIYAINGNGIGYSPVATFTTPAGAVVTSYRWAQLAGSTSSASGTANGSGTAARFSSPVALTLDGDDNLMVADSGSHTIRKIIASSAATSTQVGVANSVGSDDSGFLKTVKFNGLQGIVRDPTVANGYGFYVADSGNHTVRHSSWTLLGSWNTDTVAGSAGSSGAANGTGAAARFNRPGAVVADSAGTAYVADTGNHVIRKVTSAGVVTTLAGTAGSSGSADGAGTVARFHSPAGIALDSSGAHLYVADSGNHTIRKVVIASGEVSTLAGSAGNSGTDDGVGAAARFNGPRGLALNASGNLVVADAGNHAVRIITADGVVTSIGGLAGTAGLANGDGSTARFNGPAGICVSGTTLYLSDTDNHRITSGTPLYGPLLGLGGVAPGSDGTLVFSGWVNPNGKALSNVRFDYGLTASCGSSVSVALVSSASSAVAVSVPVSGLQPGTFYHFRLVATNADGSTTSQTGSFTTAGPATLAAVSSSDVTATSATLSGEILDSGGLEVTSRGFVYARTSVNALPALDGSGVTVLTGDGEASLLGSTASGLEAGTEYSFRAYATNSAGTSYSEVATFTTVILERVIFDNTAGKGRVLGYDGNGISPTLAFGYCVTTGDEGFDLNSITLALTDFEVATALRIRLFAADAGSLPSGPALATQDYDSRSFGNTPAYFTFPLSGFRLKANTSYILFVGASSGGASWKRYEPNINPQSSAGWTVNSMIVDSDGSFYNMVGNPDRWSIQLTGTPFVASPPSVTLPVANEIGSTSATLAGAVSDDGGAVITEFGLVYAPSSAVALPEIGGANVVLAPGAGTPAEFTADVSGLTAVTEYRVRAYATNSAGTSYSEAVTFTTLAAPPSFAGYAVTAKEGKSLAIAVAKILARATDPDGGAATLTGVFGPSAQGGTVSLTGTLNYTPPLSFTGTDSFDIELTGSQGGILRATVTVTVTGNTAAGQNQTEIRLHDGVADLTFRGIPGRSYTVQRSTNLTTWTTLATVAAGADGRITYTDPAPPQPSGYYRVQF